MTGTVEQHPNVIHRKQRALHPGELEAAYNYWSQIDPDAHVELDQTADGIIPVVHKSALFIELTESGVIEATLPHDENGNPILELPSNTHDQHATPVEPPPKELTKDHENPTPTFYRQGSLFQPILTTTAYETVSPDDPLQKWHRTQKRLRFGSDQISKILASEVQHRWREIKRKHNIPGRPGKLQLTENFKRFKENNKT